MDLQMLITTAGNSMSMPPVLDVVGESSKPLLVGPAMHGWIYRNPSGTDWFRAVPVEQTDLEWRHRVRGPRLGSHNILFPAKDWQQQIGDRTYQILSYRNSSSARALSQFFENSTAAQRLAKLVTLLRIIPGWWKTLQAPLLLLASEIIVGNDGELRLLGMASGLTPSPATLLEAPERLLSMPPEWLRSGPETQWNEKAWQAVDRYCVGVLLLSSLFQPPCIRNFDTVAVRAASGCVFAHPVNRIDLPGWLGRFPRFEKTIAAIRQLVSADVSLRSGVDFQQLADRIEKLLDLFDPFVAAKWLRDVSRPQEALDVLEELFPSADQLGITSAQQYELFCLAGELVARYLDRPLDAIDYFERAIQKDNRAQPAYREELMVIASARHHPSLAIMILHDAAVAEDVDQKLWRNYVAIFGDRAAHAENEDDAQIDRLVADYLIWRKNFVKAQQFILSRLFDRQGTYIWWDFELMLPYVHTFLGLETGNGVNLQLARDQLQQVREALLQVGHNTLMEPSQVHQIGGEIADLELFIAQQLSQIKRPMS